MQFSSILQPAILIKRYKRFLVDVQLLSTGEIITAHCPNSGAMLGVKEAGLKVWLSYSNAKTRKLPYTLEMVEVENGTLTGVNTANPNRIINEALTHKTISALAEYPHFKAEVSYGDSRFDFHLWGENLPDCYLEVKNCHLKRHSGLLEFPDSVTSRGAKHLRTLAEIAASGKRAVMLYLGQRNDCQRFTIAHDIDPTYAAAFKEAQQAGVEILCYSCLLTPQEITLHTTLPLQPLP